MAIIEIVFGDKNSNKFIDKRYETVKNELGDIFAWQMKLLQKVPWGESETKYPGKKRKSWPDLLEITSKILQIFGYKIEFDLVQNADITNKLHQVYENIHVEFVSSGIVKDQNKLKILYDFHSCIHDVEKENQPYNYWKIDWGSKGGLCTKEMVLHDFYQYPRLPNCICSAWAELGKKPLDYFLDGEPNNQDRINELVKPHINFKPGFKIFTETLSNEDFPLNFTEWWKEYEYSWCKHWNVSKWEIKHQFGCLVLAVPVDGTYHVDWHKEFPIVKKITVL